MKPYRLNVRFDLDNEQERQAVEYLEQLDRREKKSRNRFVVESVLHHMNPADTDEKMLQEIRQMLREEVSHLSVTAAAASPAAPQALTAQQQEDNLQSVLDDLEMFG